MTFNCNLHSCATYGGLYSEGRFALERANIPNAALDARVLLEFATRRSWQKLFDDEDEIVAPGEIAAYRDAILARLKRVPVAQITGVKEFWSLDFKVTKATLIPRPESEHAVERALELVPKPATGRVLDLGTGTGCLLIAILAERPGLTGVGVDLSEDALRVARENAMRLGVADRACFIRSDWAEAVEGRYDLVVSNPPYLSEAELAAAEPEVRDHEPRLALCPGTEGLEAYRAIAAALPRLLASEGAAVVEIGADQAKSVAGLMRAAGLNSPLLTKDLAGHSRVLSGRKVLTNKLLDESKKKLESAP